MLGELKDRVADAVDDHGDGMAKGAMVGAVAHVARKMFMGRRRPTRGIGAAVLVGAVGGLALSAANQSSVTADAGGGLG